MFAEERENGAERKKGMCCPRQWECPRQECRIIIVMIIIAPDTYGESGALYVSLLQMNSFGLRLGPLGNRRLDGLRQSERLFYQCLWRIGGWGRDGAGGELGRRSLRLPL